LDFFSKFLKVLGKTFIQVSAGQFQAILFSAAVSSQQKTHFYVLKAGH